MNSAASMAGIISRNPREAVGLFAASAAVMIIFINALFLQQGPHPAPIFAHTTTAVSRPQVSPQPLTVPAPPPRPNVLKPPAKIVAPPEAARNDPIARLLAPSNRVLAVQRVLTEYGYGQIRPTGVAGPETQDAIRKFEHSRNLSATGLVSDELVRALAEMSGRPLD
jgi:peptidoglycan hydrolase-like protein with peptidoglycan-binding domain